MNIPKNCGAAVCAPIVDEDDLIGLCQGAHHLCQPDIEPLCAAFFVKYGYDDRKPYPCLRFHRSYSDPLTWTFFPSQPLKCSRSAGHLCQLSQCNKNPVVPKLDAAGHYRILDLKGGQAVRFYFTLSQ